MPQFDVSTFPSQLFWLLFSFLVLFLFTKYVSAPKIADVLKHRKDKIEADLNQVEDYNRAIEAYRTKLSEQLEDARSKARDLISVAVSSMNVSTTQRKSDIIQLVNERLQSSEQYIERQRQQAAGEIKHISSQVLNATLEKLLAEKLDKREVEKAIDKAFDGIVEEKVA